MTVAGFEGCETGLYADAWRGLVDAETTVMISESVLLVSKVIASFGTRSESYLSRGISLNSMTGSKGESWTSKTRTGGEF